MYILGLNAVFHESAACLVKDGRLIAAAEEERFNRRKHGKRALTNNAHELPWQAIESCLAQAGISLAEVDAVAYSASPDRFRATVDRPLCDLGPEMLVSLESIPDLLAAQGFRGEMHWVDHHEAHAASAFLVSPFDEAAILVADGRGEGDSTWLGYGVGHRIETLGAVPLPASIGFLWELISLFLGFGVYDAAKVMGLAAYGEPVRYAGALARIAPPLDDGRFTVDETLARFGSIGYYPPQADFSALTELLGVAPRGTGSLGPEHYDLAAALQDHTDRLLGGLARHLYAATGSRNLCVAGGVGLNCVSNRKLLVHGPFDRLFVQPAAHDAGTAIGAAYHIWHSVLGRSERHAMTHAYLGPSFDDAVIEARLQAHGLCYRRSDDIAEEVAGLVARGRVVAFFQGRMELGPRALGNRSLLVDPRDPNVRETLNRKVKHREFFRPFAPSVLEDEAGRWFDIEKETSASEYMLTTWPVRPECRERIPAVVHVDGSARVQIVRQAVNPRFHAVLSAFYRLTGVPVLLNTSFNDSEPIVCSPDDAIETFRKTRIDHLIMEDFVVDAVNANGDRLST